MASSFEEAAEVCRNEKFKFKIKLGMARVATIVLEERNNIPFHNKRATWAIRALARPDEEARKVCLVLAVEPGITLATGDGALLAAIMDGVNTYAGAFTPEAVEAAETSAPLEVIEELTDHDNNPATAPVITKRTLFRRVFGGARS